MLLFLCDRGIYAVLSTAFFKTEAGQSGGFINKILKVRANALIIGSSRAKHHYDPEIFEKTLHVSTYNAGANRQGMPYIRALTDLVLQTYTPKIIILNVDATNIVYSQEENESIKNLAPFIDRSDALKNILYAQGLFEPIKYLSMSYRYNSKLFPIIKNLYFPDEEGNGFSGLHRTMDPAHFALPWKTEKAKTLSADPKALTLLRETIRAAHQYGVQVFVVNSPRWRPDGIVDPAQKPLLAFIEHTAKAEKARYHEVTIERYPVFQEASLFADPAHLNARGARLFSDIVAQWILTERCAGTF